MNSGFFHSRLWLLSFLIVLSAGFVVPAQTTPQITENEKANATIKGRVIWKGRGVADCSVFTWDGPFSEVSQGAPRTRTDADGNFRFSVKAGNHYVWVIARNFYVVVDGKPSLKPVRVAVDSGEELTDVNFSLQQGGVVTGKVVNADNSPAIETEVTLIPIQQPEAAFGTTSPLWTTVITDDRGIYRLYGVPPGQYRVAAGAISPAYNAMRGRLAVPRTYFPDLLEEAKAKAVAVSNGEEVSGINIKLASPKPVYFVRGKVIDGATGAPIQNLRVGLEIYDGDKRIGGRGGNDFTNDQGEFEIAGVPTGRYSLHVPGVNEPVENFGRSEQFEVVDQDVSGIVIRTARTASVSGVVTIDGKSNSQLAQRLKTTWFVAFTIPSEAGRGSSQPFSINEDRTFAVSGLFPGRLNINFTLPASGNLPPLRVLRVEHEGGSDPIELYAGDRVTGLRVVVVEASSSLRGQVKFVDGSTPVNFSGSAGIYADQLTIGWSPLDQRGNFLLENLPAGAFRLMVTVAIPGMTPASTRRVQNVVLNPGEASETTIWIDPKPEPPPKLP